jgi:peptidoglycan/xylan/chitin deacetylase (PgdA/CDA1 family)
MRDRVLVLAYHNIVPADTPLVGDLPNHLSLPSFSAQLAELRATHDVVSLSETLVARPRGSTRPRAAITFDDAYRGAVIYGVAEVVRQGLPATIFVAPALLGGGPFWWDALAREGGGGLDPSVRSHALGELTGNTSTILAWALSSGLRIGTLPGVAHPASEDEVTRAASLPGITLGSHSWSHPSLPRLPSEALEKELRQSLAWLKQRATGPLPWIAYPYGNQDASVALAAEAAGYQAALGISGGWYPQVPEHRFALPRVNVVPGLSHRGFVLRGAGLLTE